ncbi:MAG TPA: hypothetical protein VJT09_16985 [Pyrinomonadaceae bacterium]|nr:hypothetical protein [Pyrinomonadaceae bacterium]
MPRASTYLRAIEKALAAGNATEHTHRPALKSFIEQLADGITATNEPSHSGASLSFHGDSCSHPCA